MTPWPFGLCERAAKFGRLAQLVRALPSHGRGQRFKSFVAHHPSSNFILAENHHFDRAAWGCVSMLSCYPKDIHGYPWNLHLASRTEGTSREPCSTATIWTPSE